MNRYALVLNGVCITVVQQATTPTAPGQWLNVTVLAVGPGHRWQGGSVWLQPEAGPRYITRLAFRSRFTTAEKIAIEIASLDNPAASLAARQQAASLRIFQADVDTALWIDLDRADTRAGALSLETSGLLAAGRSGTILDAPIANFERVPT